MGSNPVPVQNGSYRAPGIIRYLANNTNQQHHQQINNNNSSNGDGNAGTIPIAATNNHQNDGTSSTTSDLNMPGQHSGMGVSAPLHHPYQQQQQQQQPQQQPHQFQYPVHQHAHGIMPAAVQSNTSVTAPVMQTQQQPLQQQSQTQQPLQQQPSGMAGDFDTPSIFRNMSLRRGKWTQEEEDYADFLIKEFEKGTISGLENGCTLRAFLSKKLHCAPMRISKKYAGKSIGKHVFLSRKPGINKNANGGGTTDEGDTSDDNDKKLEELANKFYKSLFQDGEGCAANNPMVQQFKLGQCFPHTQHGLPPPPHHQPPHVAGALPQHIFNQPLHYPGLGPYIQPHQTFGLSGQVPVQAPFVPQANGMALPQPDAKNLAPVPQQQPQQQQQTSVAQPSAAKIQQHMAANISQLQETYLKALKQMNVSPPAGTPLGQGDASVPQIKENKILAAPTMTSNAANIQPSSHRPQPQPVSVQAKSIPAVPTTASTTHQPVEVAPQAKELKQSSASTLNTSRNKQPAASLLAQQQRPLLPPIPLQNPGNQPIAPLSSSPKQTQNQNPNILVHPAGQPPASAQLPTPYGSSASSFEIPDFLSGFEKVTGQKQPPGDFLQGAESQYSPTFTSRSFDELHQFLGKGDFDQEPLDLGGMHQYAEGVPQQEQQNNVAAAPSVDSTKDLIIAEAKGMPHPPLNGNSNSSDGNDYSIPALSSGGAGSSILNFVTADAYAMFAQQSALAVSQHSAYCRSDSSDRPLTNSRPSVPNINQAPCFQLPVDNKNMPTVILDNAASSSKVNAANLRAHAKAAEQTANVGTSTTKSKLQTYMRRHANIVSSSEQSNSDMGTEESESALGSSRGSGSEGSESNEPSDNTSNDSDSQSDEGPVHKKQKAANSPLQAQKREGILPVSSNLPSHRGL